jgi:signal transduction histidine kinase
MGTLLYIRLIGFTAGTLLMLFWLVVILGYRRQRNFERVFFFLCLALFFFYSGSLLALNAQIYYAQPPAALQRFAISLVCLGLSFLPPLLFHLHLEFAETRGIGRSRRWKRIFLALAYSPSVYFLCVALPGFLRVGQFDFVRPGASLGPLFLAWLFILTFFSCGWDRKFARATLGRPERGLYRLLWLALVAALVLIAIVHPPLWGLSRGMTEALATALALLPLIPLASFIYFVQRHNFLNIGRQKNLLYAVSTTFVALLYLALVRRISDWLSPVIPPEATAAILLFLLVVFIEPLQRALRSALRETARREMNVVHRLSNRIQMEARQGSTIRLIQFVESRVREEFDFEDAWLTILEPPLAIPNDKNRSRESKESFSVHRPGRLNAVLELRPHGPMLSGEAIAAMEFLCESIAGALDLSLLLEEKLRLERELSERERMAALGQMAASISHNLKNPLGSIKTILQVQLESAEMPESLKTETRMVLGEISRLSNKLGQLLQFSRPTVLGEGNMPFDVCAVVHEVTAVMRPEAEQKGIALQVSAENGIRVMASREAVSDIVSNLVVNGLEAATEDGHVTVSLVRRDGHALICVQDDGKGISAELREKVMEPFFTTKTQGTGLGLAIVARRASEAGGKIELESPAANGHGARFSVWLPMEKQEKAK